jgi:uncharacterized protein with HEPN domain
MPSEKRSNDALRDIARNILLAKSFIESASFESFEADDKTVDATTRCLEFISEASRRLSIDTKGRHPQIPWRQIASAGNIYRHDYESILPWLVWKTVNENLDLLLAVVRAELER